MTQVFELLQRVAPVSVIPLNIEGWRNNAGSCFIFDAVELKIFFGFARREPGEDVFGETVYFIHLKHGIFYLFIIYLKILSVLE